MENTGSSHYKILEIIYSIVKDDHSPLKYQVHPRELILYSSQDWDVIQSSLPFLEKEGLIEIRQLGTLHVSLTEQGLDLCKTLPSLI